MGTALVGCGGGGGGGSTPANQPSAIGDNTSVPALVASAYPTGSEELAAFNLLNQERSRCGFGLLSQSTVLDAAAKSHAQWSLLNNQFSHVENRNFYPYGFTGSTVVDRALRQGFDIGSGPYYVGEVMTLFFSNANKTGVGNKSIRILLNAPYHLSLLISGFKEAGFSAQDSTEMGLTSDKSMFVSELSYSSLSGGQHLLASDTVATYPCEGATGVMYKLENESPNPVPGRDLAANPLGVTVAIKVREGQNLDVTSASMVQTSTGSSVALRPMVGGNGIVDVHNDYNASTAFISADAPLLPNTQYTMQIVGSNNGTPFTKTFTFTTGD